jgi:hypothetical protein
MKDKHGNGMTIEEINTLTELAVSYKNSISQNGNNHITYFHTWDFKSRFSDNLFNRSDEATFAEQKKVIEAWRTLDNPQGIHLRVREATISFSEKVSIDLYYEWLNTGDAE